MRVHLCGVRGSTPAPGPQFSRYGGHTSCVAVAHDGQAPSLLLDAGTGIRNVTALLDGFAFHGAILLSHLHWDHTTGLPFFSAGDRDDARVAVYAPAQEGGDAAALLSRAMSPPTFPITPAQLRGSWTFNDLDEGATTLGGFAVMAREIPHKGGRTFGYRITDGRAAIAYLSDHHPLSAGPGSHGEGEYHRSAVELAADVDLLIHDAQYTSAEFAARSSYGHSTIRYAVGLGRVARARRVLLFHHDPSRTDEQLDAIAAAVGDHDLDVAVAREDSMIDLLAHLPLR